MTIKILGAEYTVLTKKYNEDEAFERRSIDGYCDEWSKEIVVCDLHSYPGWEHEPEQTVTSAQRETLRHEIVHAFFSESGLGDSSARYDGAYSKNEELIDWIAIQGPKIYAAWKEADCLG